MNRTDPRLRKVAMDFWFVVQRMARRSEPPASSDDDEPGIDDDGLAGSRVPRRPSDSSGSASVQVEPEDDPASDV